MPRLTPVDYDPFAQGAPPAADGGLRFTPVDRDPFSLVVEPPARPEPPVATPAEEIAGHPVTRFAMGAASPVLGAVQLGANIGDYLAEKIGLDPVVGKAINQHLAELERMKQRGMEARGGIPEGEGAFDLAGLGGAVVNPAGLAYTRGLPAATSAGQRVLQGGKVGAFYGGTAPVTSGGDQFFQEKGGQAVLGAGFGAGLPAGWEGAKFLGRTARDVGNLVRKGGAERIIQNYYKSILPDDKQPLITALKGARSLVPGSRPTAAEATVGVPGGSAISAQQKLTAGTPGNVSPRFEARFTEQARAREAVISGISKTKAGMTAAEQQRAANALKNYSEAYSKAIKGDRELLDISRDPYFRKALVDARDLAASKGVSPKENLTEFLHTVKLSMDKMLGRKGDTALSRDEIRQVEAVKNRLLGWMEKKNPAYRTAREAYAAESGPINRMQIGQQLKEKLVSPLASEGDQALTERAGSFAQALRDAPGTIKRSTGFARESELGKILTPDELAAAQAVAQDLARRAAAANPAQRTTLQGGVNVADETRAHLPQMLSRPMMLANAVLKALAGRRGSGIEREIDEIMATHFLEPAQMAQVLERIHPAQRTMVAERYANLLRNPSLGAIVLGAQEKAQQEAPAAP